MKKPIFRDLTDRNERERIRQIGMTAMQNPGKQVGILTDAEPGKPERYIAQLQEWFPGIEVVSQTPGPIEGVVTIVIQRRAV